MGRNRKVSYEKKKGVIAIAIGVFFLFSLLIVQFFRLQVIEHDKWLDRAKAQHQIVVKEPFHRGTFYSNTTIKEGHPEEAQPLVIDVSKVHLYIDPYSIPLEYREEVSSALLNYFAVDDSQLERYYYHFSLEKSRSRKVAMWLEKEEMDQILEWWKPFAKSHKIPKNALYFVKDYKRSYPYGHLLGQVLHTIRDTKEETTSQGIPTGGLELYFSKFLEGSFGKRRLLRSPSHPLDSGEIIESAKDGSDVYLTVNRYLQAIAEQELAKGVKIAKASGGWAIIMKPDTGEILALAQYPFFFTPKLSRIF